MKIVIKMSFSIQKLASYVCSICQISHQIENQKDKNNNFLTCQEEHVSLYLVLTALNITTKYN